MTAKRDITGQRFGDLVAIRRVEKDKNGKSCWECRCKCGNTTVVTQNNLVSHIVKSCGCSKKIPPNYVYLDRLRFGKLVVLKRNGSRPNGKGSRSKWLCRCDCGKTTTVCSKELLNNHTTSCGCAHSEQLAKRNWKGCGEMPGSVWCSVRHGAKARNITVAMTMEDAWRKFQDQGGKCALTNLPLCFGRNSKRLGTEARTASLDRIDSKKGYTADNVQWVHKRIQKMKNDLPQEEFISFCRLVSQHTSLSCPTPSP